MAVKAFQCPGCGAKLTPQPGHSTITCTYCSTTSQVQQRGSPWGAHNAQIASDAATHAARARKAVLWSTAAGVGLAVVGMAAAFALGAPSTPPPLPSPSARANVPHAPSPTPTPVAPAAAMDPEAALVAARAARLQAYVVECMNSLDDRILSSRARYRSWVDDEEGPEHGARHVYGLYTFADPGRCAEQVRAASALAPRYLEMDEAAQAYVNAVTELHGRVEEAERYYDRNDYLDDRMARGQALHQPLMDGFNRFIMARETLIMHTDQTFTEALEAREAALAPGDTGGRLFLDTLRSALALAKMSNVHWRDVGDIDEAQLTARVDGYQRQIDELESHVAQDDRVLQSYVQASQAFALAAKELRRRVERGGGWSRGDRMMLDGVGSHWMVTGSPGAVLGKYEDLAGVRGLSPPLRYIAPTALLSDGY